jgi:hypothetical protein
MWGHFWHLHFNSFPMTWRTHQDVVFWPLQSNSEVSEVLEDSQVLVSEVWVSSSHSSKSGVATLPNVLIFLWIDLIPSRISKVGGLWPKWMGYHKYNIKMKKLPKQLCDTPPHMNYTWPLSYCWTSWHITTKKWCFATSLTTHYIYTLWMLTNKLYEL